MFSKKTHRENWVSFWNEVEKIKKLQMVAEFTDYDDKTDRKWVYLLKRKSDYSEIARA